MRIVLDDDADSTSITGMHAGDRVRIRVGTFDGVEGTVTDIDRCRGRVTVTINIFGRDVPIRLELHQIELV